MDEDKEEIYETTVSVLNLGYSVEDASERLGKLVFINDLLEEPVKCDWSHLKNPEFRERTKRRITHRIQRLEMRR